MERITISLDEDLARQFDGFMQSQGYRNRSEAIRDLIRERLVAERLGSPEGEHCVGSLTYVYNHHERELASRLTRAQHHHHDLALSTMHVHLDHDHCLETVILRGHTAEVRDFAQSVVAQPGVRHGAFHLIPVDMEQSAHGQGQHHGHDHAHVHSRPKT